MLNEAYTLIVNHPFSIAPKQPKMISPCRYVLLTLPLKRHTPFRKRALG